MPETVLYPTIKRFPEAAGFHVKGEIHGCDVVAVRDGEGSMVTVLFLEVVNGLFNLGWV
jgi:hypothetical protein